MGKGTDLKLRKALDRVAEVRSALEGLVKAVGRMLDGEEETEDFMELELAATGLRQALETAQGALGGSEWDKWGEWEQMSKDLPPNLQKAMDVRGGAPDKILRNNLFEVWITIHKMLDDDGNPPIAELSVKRRDKLPIDYNHWRTLQRIKNELLGINADGAMLYPCAARVIDSANQYRIYALPPGILMPFGDQSRLVTSKALSGDDNPRNGSRQRPYGPDEKLSDDLVDNPAKLKELLSEFSELTGIDVSELGGSGESS